MNPNNLNLYIVDDDQPMRKSLGALILARLDGFAVQSFESGEAFLDNAHVDASGIAILDLRFDDVSGQVGRMSGLEVFQALKDRKSPLVVIFLSGHGTIPEVVDAMQDGAVSWLQKPCSEDVLLGTVQAAKEKAQSIAANRRARHAAIEMWGRLSDREKEVAPVIARGMSAKDTSRFLTNLDLQRPIDHRTVENHWAKIRAKLDVANSNELQRFLTSYFPELLEDQSKS
ncbi:MAG TPA: response regulator [Rhodoferax sp.]|jgi:FixJ family two-component response regulator|nr:response regulator [Rhodoferax sp.]HPW29435.1 response regulator [Rhodoferax sp.]